MLDFLGLHDSYQEDDLEAAIVQEMEGFPSNWEWASASWPARSGSNWTATIITWI